MTPAAETLRLRFAPPQSDKVNSCVLKNTFSFDTKTKKPTRNWVGFFIALFPKKSHQGIDICQRTDYDIFITMSKLH